MKSVTYALFTALLLLGLTNCKTTEAYQKAQTAFSQGASVEMRERFADAADQMPSNFLYFDDLYQKGEPADEAVSADEYYAQAMDNINQALRSQGPLKKVMALDNAYAIKALTLWRQGQLDEARKTALLAIPLLEQNDGEENDIRDLAMMRALPGLINVDEAYNVLQKIETWGKAITQATDREEKLALYGKIKATYRDAAINNEDGATSVVRGLKLIEDAIDGMDGESAIEIYLRNAQLAGLDSWGDMLVVLDLSARRVNESPEDIVWAGDERGAYDAKVSDHLKKLETLLPNGRENKLYRYWVRLL